MSWRERNSFRHELSLNVLVGCAVVPGSVVSACFGSFRDYFTLASMKKKNTPEIGVRETCPMFRHKKCRFRNTSVAGIVLCVSFLFARTLSADVVPAPLFRDHAVLQQGKPVPVWGTAAPGESVTVTYASPGTTRSATATADPEGRWKVMLEALPSSAESATLTMSGNNTIVRKDVLVGEVWLASGQSNMDVALFWTGKGKQIAATADYPLIRYFKVGTVASDTPKDTLRGGWALCVPKSSAGFTQLGFHFASQLFQKLKVPVGIINSSYGGTSIDAWMDAKSLAADPAGPTLQERWKTVLEGYPAKLESYEKAKASRMAEKEAAKAAGTEYIGKPPLLPPIGPGSQYAPSGLYNAMIHPLVPYAIRGVIWYQGENNAKRPGDYRTLFPSLINGWRALFCQGDIPFYWVQLPNYNIGAEAADWPGVRSAQSAALSLPETGQAVTVDIGDAGNIHPENKEEVARRLALIAFARTYGEKGLVESGPVFERAVFEKETRVYFRNSAAGLKMKESATLIGGFQLAGADKVFHDAGARIEKSDTVVLSSPAVPNPVAVRYAWSNNPKNLSLANSEKLPAAPFRTDDW